jgi:transposase
MFIQSRTYAPTGKMNHLLMEAFRENGKPKKRTVANLSRLPPEAIEVLKASLKGEKLVKANDVICKVQCTDTVPWGDAEAVTEAMERLGIAEMIDPKPSVERNIALALVASRIISPMSKYSTFESWSCSSLVEKFSLEGVKASDLYTSMDWLLSRQTAIETALAKRHLTDGCLAFLDVSSSYYEGTKSTLINREKGDNDDADDADEGTLLRFGHSRDGKKDKPQITYRLLTDDCGRPVSIEVYPGNTSDVTVFLPTVEKIRNTFGLSKVVMVGDRGMISSKQITVLKETPGVDWISALRHVSIKSLVPKYPTIIGLFHERDLVEFTAPEEYPGERLVGCRNPDLAIKSAKTRDKLIERTRKALDKIVVRVAAGRLKTDVAIAQAVEKVINKSKMKRHILTVIGNGTFSYSLNKKTIALEQSLDGIYVIRTSLQVTAMSKDDCVRGYKNLAQVERAFRSIKTIDLNVRPIRHFLDNRIRSHMFLTMLSYYVQWHMMEAWRELTFADTGLREWKKTRNPVTAAVKSPEAAAKAGSKKLGDASTVEGRAQSFRLLLKNLGNINEVYLVIRAGIATEEDIPFKRMKEFTPIQARALELIKTIPLYPPS